MSTLQEEHGAATESRPRLTRTQASGGRLSIPGHTTDGGPPLTVKQLIREIYRGLRTYPAGLRSEFA